MEENSHRAFVDAWMDRAAKDVPNEQFVPVFARAFSALWQRAHLTLGDVTLMAILDRVLYRGSEQFPMLALLRMDEAGLGCEELHQRAGSFASGPFQAGLRFVLVEFLTILGNLTAEILTPALHSELSKVAQQVPGTKP